MSDPGIHRALTRRFAPVLDDLVERAQVADRFVDKDLYRIMVATLWANVVLDPKDIGLTEAALEPLHDVLNAHIRGVLGQAEDLTACYRFLNSKGGEQAMNAAHLTQNHKDLLLYFASIILDPEGHRRWMAKISERPER
ncbi:MAG: hypothetical protein R3E86_15165 [Pseudomonadales bacterium]